MRPLSVGLEYVEMGIPLLPFQSSGSGLKSDLKR